MNKSVNEKYDASGLVTREVRHEVESRDWRGKSYLDICEFAESEIRRRGAECAFPVNVCANESAAHYTAEIDDTKVVDETSILKVDLGAHVDGYVTDSSVTLCYNESLLDMTEATRAALSEAIKTVSAGGRTGDVGRVVESYAARRGYLPIENLSGHALEQYVVHAGVSIPNVGGVSTSSFKLDKVYAIEPFFTTTEGSGYVDEGKTRNIYSLVTRKRTKDPKLDEFVELLWSTRRSLPFAARWYKEYYARQNLDKMLSQLLKLHLVHAYPELIESAKTPISQAEHTIRVTSSGPIILT